MTHRQPISCFVSRIAVSLVLWLLLAPSAAYGQKIFRLEKDSIPFFKGFQVSFDLASAAQLMLSDHGELEGTLRINLHDQWFPVFEMGIGRANHKEDETTGLIYKTTAPYFRLGMDINVLKNKHQPNRLYAGLRYACTFFKADIQNPSLKDDAQIYGPLHLGWTIRYLRRLAQKSDDIGDAWYVPGFGLNGKDNFVGNVNVIIDI